MRTDAITTSQTGIANSGPVGIRLGLGANWRQFALLVATNAFVGGMREGEIAPTGQLQRIVFNDNWEEMRREMLLRDLHQRAVLGFLIDET